MHFLSFIHNDEKERYCSLVYMEGMIIKSISGEEQWNNSGGEKKRDGRRESDLNRINSEQVKLALWVKNYQTIRDKWPTKYHRRCCCRRVCRLFFEYWMLNSWKLVLLHFQPPSFYLSLSSLLHLIQTHINDR